MTSQSYNETTMLQFSPLSEAGKRLLQLSSPLSSLFGAKRTRLAEASLTVSQEQEVNSSIIDTESQTMETDVFGALNAMSDGHEPEGNGRDTPNGNREFIVISSDPPTADVESGSVWSMHTATSESNGLEENAALISIAHSIKDFFFHRGQDRLIGTDSFPTVIYVNRENGKVYQSVVDRELFFMRRDLTGFEERGLWLQTNVYIGDLYDSCINLTSNPIEAFPILHRHDNHLAVTSDYGHLTDDSNTASSLKSAVRREWQRLVTRYGDFNDIQHEQKALVDKAFSLLGHYQAAVASRDLMDAMKINGMIGLLGDALNELALNEYVIRELFYRDTSPAFLSAIA